MANCSGCGAPVFWLPNSRTRRKAPVDIDPVNGGNVVIEGEGDKRTYRVLTKKEMTGSLFDQAPAGDRYTLHFATCPKAEHFRRDHIAHVDREPDRPNRQVRKARPAV